MLPALHPGAHILIASNVLLTHIVDNALANAGLEKRATLVRLVQTLRGGDRPKLADKEFPEVGVMPRTGWEPRSVFRKPLLPGERVSASLRLRGTGALRRPAVDMPFGDIIPSVRTSKRERAIAPHPSLKPQQFMRAIVRAALPLGTGIILDPFAGGGSTLAAAESLGYHAIGTEANAKFAQLAAAAIPRLAALQVTPARGSEEPSIETPRASNKRIQRHPATDTSHRPRVRHVPDTPLHDLWAISAEPMAALLVPAHTTTRW